MSAGDGALLSLKAEEEEEEEDETYFGRRMEG